MQNNLIEQIASLQNNSKLSDIKFIVNEKAFYGHKVLFGLTSLVLLEKFEKEPNLKQIDIENINEIEFQEIMNYVYQRKVEINFRNIKSLLNFAKVYQIEDLLLSCLEFLEKNIANQNCFIIFDISIKFQLDDLKEKTSKVIHESKDCFKQEHVLDSFDDETLAQISLIRNDLTEIYFFRRIIEWGNYKIENENHENQENQPNIDLKNKIVPLLNSLNFSNLSESDLQEIWDSQVFSGEQLVQLIPDGVHEEFKNKIKQTNNLTGIWKGEMNTQNGKLGFIGVLFQKENQIDGVIQFNIGGHAGKITGTINNLDLDLIYKQEDPRIGYWAELKGTRSFNGKEIIGKGDHGENEKKRKKSVTWKITRDFLEDIISDEVNSISGIWNGTVQGKSKKNSFYIFLIQFVDKLRGIVVFEDFNSGIIEGTIEENKFVFVYKNHDKIKGYWAKIFAIIDEQNLILNGQGPHGNHNKTRKDFLTWEMKKEK
ncbi:hypothetical protein M0811_04125 [Anaeramoeba ignava]|uniref:BTB domain-containing protein n=1 Tax=Anaeramoeba ignava TaxID=1746090 RepID=A0A9Q0RH24_ANAIG|nr:hypothetical protein M0811_04125 [Anaeramoeba ignava]